MDAPSFSLDPDGDLAASFEDRYTREKEKRKLLELECFLQSDEEVGTSNYVSCQMVEAVVGELEALIGEQAYSNRAASYTKLGTFPEGLKDANKCIELDPKFSKGYSRKGAIQFFMKEYDKALETYQTGLKYDEGNQELLDGIHRCIEQINKANRGDISAEDLKERQATPMDRFKAVKIYFSEMLKAYPRQQIHEDIWTMALTVVKDRVYLSDPAVVRDLYCYMIKTDIDNCDPRRVFIFRKIDELNMIIEDL